MVTRLSSEPFSDCEPNLTFICLVPPRSYGSEYVFSVASQRDRCYSLSLYTFIIELDWKPNLSLNHICTISPVLGRVLQVGFWFHRSWHIYIKSIPICAPCSYNLINGHVHEIGLNGCWTRTYTPTVQWPVNSTFWMFCVLTMETSYFEGFLRK